MVDLDVRLGEMDRMGVQYQAAAIAPAQYYYWADPDAGAKAVTCINDGSRKWCRSVPTASSASARRRCRTRMRPSTSSSASVRPRTASVASPSNPSAQRIDYDDARYDAFWAKAAELESVIVLHPNGFCSGERLTDYYLINVVGNPMETTVAFTRIIVGGVLERHPSLIVAVHGGGYLGFYMDRMDHAAEQRDDVGYNLSRPPSDYLKAMYFDTVVHNPDALAYLLSRVGSDHVVLGTDYPYDMGVMDPVAHADKIPNLDPADGRRIVGGNAAKLLGIDG